MLTFSQKQRLKWKRTPWKKPAWSKPPKGNIVKIYEHLTNNPTKVSGRAYTAICPFHEEQRPSCALYKDTASAYCFSCNWTGDSIKMVMDIQECDFKESVRIIKSI